MRSLSPVLLVLAGDALAHPGHGAAEGHFHVWGPEHGLLLAVILGLLAFAMRK